MKAAAADLRAKQVDDRFEIIPRPRPPDPNLQEWRIRCLDCPGKVSSAIYGGALSPSHHRRPHQAFARNETKSQWTDLAFASFVRNVISAL